MQIGGEELSQEAMGELSRPHFENMKYELVASYDSMETTNFGPNEKAISFKEVKFNIFWMSWNAVQVNHRVAFEFPSRVPQNGVWFALFSG